MTMPSQQAALIVGPPGFATIRNVTATPTATGFTVTGITDQPIQLDLDWWPQDSALPVGPGSSTPEAGPTTNHSFPVVIGPGYTGKVFGFNFRQDSNDTSGLSWRPVQGLVQLTGNRVAKNLAVPVRFYQFGGTPPPGAGGTQPGGGGPNIGNWSTYTWAQYNPKQTTYPTP